MRSATHSRRRFRDGRAGWVRLVSLLAVLLLVLAACGNGDDDDDAGTGTGTGTGTEAETGEDAAAEGGGDPEVTELTIGTLPIVDVAPLQVAVDEGHFEEEGLQVTLETMQGGAAAIPGLVNGELDLAFGAWPSFFQAITEGIELRAVANGVRAQEEFTMLLAGEGSDLEGDPAGLAGRTVAVNTLNNLGELAVRSAVQEAGGDPDSVELAEIAFPDMLAALEQGNVDAIWAVEPFTTRAQQELGAVPVVDAYIGPMEQFPVAGFQATAEFVESNPNTVAAVQRALEAATEVVNTETDRLTQEILPDLAGLEPEVAEALHLPEFISELDPAELQRVVDFTYEFGILSEELQASDYIVEQ